MPAPKLTAEIARDKRGDWTITAGRYAAVLPATGPEIDAWVAWGKPRTITPHYERATPERVLKVAKKVVSRERHKPAEPKRYEYRNGSGNWWYAFVPLDGEESVTMRPVAMRHPYVAAGNYATEWAVFCDSPRCQDSELLTRDGTRCVALINRDDYLDPGLISVQITDRAERAAYDARNAHIQWHRETFGINGRVLLDRWLIAHANATIPEPDRTELDRQLAIAKAGA